MLKCVVRLDALRALRENNRLTRGLDLALHVVQSVIMRWFTPPVALRTRLTTPVDRFRDATR